MEIEILATESLGARSLCCLVTAQGQKVLIDPGIALGYTRYGLLPHPLQVAVDERIRHKIVEAWSEATDIVISHFHGAFMDACLGQPKKGWGYCSFPSPSHTAQVIAWTPW